MLDLDDMAWALCSFLGMYISFNLFGVRRMGVLLRHFTYRCQDVLKMSGEAFSVQALGCRRTLTSLVLMTVAVA